MEKIRNKRYLMAIALATAVVLLLALCPSAAVEWLYPFDRVRIFLSQRLVPAVSAVFHASSVAAENRELRRANGALALARNEACRLSAENARLREMLSFSKRVPGHWVAAEILSPRGGAVGVRRLVRLSRGAADGIAVNAVAVVPEGLVGRVVSVSAHTSSVMLLTDPSLRVACEIETGAGGLVPRGILSGGGDERLAVRHLTRAAGLAASQQRVVTSGLGGIFPQGLVIGHLVGLEGSTGFVRLAADLSALEYVFIRRED